MDVGAVGFDCAIGNEPPDLTLYAKSKPEWNSEHNHPDERGASAMTDLQMYILVAIPLVGIVSNTALYVHLSSRMGTRFVSVETRLDLILGKISDLDSRVAVLEDRGA